jgi:hypothetical protein
MEYKVSPLLTVCVLESEPYDGVLTDVVEDEEIEEDEGVEDVE